MKILLAFCLIIAALPSQAALFDGIYDKDRRLFNEAEIQNLQQKYAEIHKQDVEKICLSLAFERNEILARKGSFFEHRMMRLFFDTLDWYRPEFAFTLNRLNSFEKGNYERFVIYEKKAGCQVYWKRWE